jgi:hypothetical protein
MMLTLLLLSGWLVGARVLAGSARSLDANVRMEVTRPYESTSKSESAEPVPMATPPPSEEHHSNGDDILVIILR